MALANAGYHHILIGDIDVTALNDGILQAATQYLVGATGAEADAMLAAAFRAVPPRITLSAFLVQFASRTILIDTGAGKTMGDGLGFLPTRLSALGVAAGQIETILLTHFHGDHVGGLTDSEGGTLYPNAEIVVPAAEAAFWLDEATAARAPEAARAGFATAQRALAPYRSRIRTVENGEVVPGITIEALPGHTPGHSGYMITSGPDSLLVWGDIVHLPALQFARPEIGMVFDSDVAQAQATRRRVLKRAASEQLHVAGMHHDFPCFGHVVTEGDAFAFVPEIWTP